MSKELYAILAEVSTFGSIAVYTPYTSVSANTYLLPPPTTLVGALAYAYKRALNDLRELDVNGYSPAVELVQKKKVLYAAAGIVKPYTVSKTIEKIYQHIYLRKQHWKIAEMAYTVGVRSVVLVDKLYILFVTSTKDLTKYCYGITRLGRKESLVAVERVIVAPVKESLRKREFCETSFYFPSNIARDYSPKDAWIKSAIPTLHLDNFIKRTAVVEEAYIIPSPYIDRKATVHINENGAILEINTNDGKRLEIPIPRTVIEN